MYHEFGLNAFAHLTKVPDIAVAIQEYKKIERHAFSLSKTKVNVRNLQQTYH